MLRLLPGSLLTYIREVAPPLDGISGARSTGNVAVTRLTERRAQDYVNASQADNAAIGIVLPP